MKQFTIYNKHTTPYTEFSFKVYTTQRGMLRGIKNFCNRTKNPLQKRFDNSRLMGFHLTCWSLRSKPRCFSQIIFLHEQDDHMIETIIHECTHAMIALDKRKHLTEEQFCKYLGEVSEWVIKQLYGTRRLK